MNGQNAALASIGQRFGARLLDVLLVSVPAVAIAAPFVVPGIESAIRTAGEDQELLQILVARQILPVFLAWTVASALYEIPLVARRGQTVGKMAVGIRIAMSDAGPPTWQASAIRWAVPQIGTVLRFAPGPAGAFGAAAVIVWLWMLWDPLRQGLHDKAAGTVVVCGTTATPSAT